MERTGAMSRVTSRTTDFYPHEPLIEDPSESEGESDLEDLPLSGQPSYNKSLTRELEERPFLARARLAAEVLVLFVFLFYLDIALDGLSIWSMWSTDNPQLALLNVAGMVTAAFLGLWHIVQSVEIGDHMEGTVTHGRMIIFGVLYMVHLHMFYLGYLSIRDGRLHPFMVHIKAVESSFEAMVSSNVQAYFVIWSDVEGRARTYLLFSILSSVVCLGLGHFAAFDLTSKGFHGVDGTTTLSSLRFWEVGLLRTCEVMARVCSLALFNRACRPYGAVIEVGIEAVLWFVAVQWFGGILVNALPSVFCYMNPLFERSNAGSVPFHFYYIVRFASIALMAVVAMVWRGGSLEEIFSDDHDFVQALAFSVIGMAVLLPVIRWQAVDSLRLYEEPRWCKKKFTTTERRLLAELTKRFADEPEGRELKQRCLRSVKKRMRQLETLLEKERKEKISDSVLRTRVQKFLTAASNCPIKEASGKSQSQLCQLLLRIAAGVVTDPAKDASPLFFWADVNNYGAVQLAIDLCEAGSAEVQVASLKLALLINKQLGRSDAKKSLKGSGVVNISWALLSSDDMLDKDVGIQAIDVLVSSGEGLKELVDQELANADSELASMRPQFVGAALMYAVDTKSSALECKVLHDIFHKYTMHSFAWQADTASAHRISENAKSAYECIGGLAIHALMEMRRQDDSVGKEWSLPESDLAEQWRQELRTLDEFFAELAQQTLEMPEGAEDSLQQMVSEFTRTLFDAKLHEKHGGLDNIANKAIDTGLLEVLRRVCTVPSPKDQCLKMLKQCVFIVASSCGTDSAITARLAMTLATREWLDMLPSQMVSETQWIREDAFEIAKWLCPVEALGSRMVGVLKKCVVGDRVLPFDRIARLAQNLCLSERSADELRNSELMQIMVPVAVQPGESQFDAMSVVCMLFRSNDTDALKTVCVDNPGSAKILVDNIGNLERQSWAPFLPLLKLCHFELGRGALIENNAIKALRSWIQRDLSAINEGEQLSPQRMKALDYAMQALLQLVSHSKAAEEQILRDEVVDGVDDGFRDKIEAVKHTVPSLFQQATELRLYWAGGQTSRQRKTPYRW